MSETTAPTYLVTLSDWNSDTEGTLAWALTQANAYTGEGVPTIAFDASLNGEYLYCYKDVTRDMRFVNLGSEKQEWSIGSLAAGTSLILEEGIALRGADVYGTLDCREGSELDSSTIHSGAVLKSHGARTVGMLWLEHGCRLEGTELVVARKEGYSSSIDLAEWVGSTADAFAGLDKLSSENGPLRIDVRPAGDCTLAAIPGVEVIYALSLYPDFSGVVTLEPGQVLSGGSVTGTLDCKPGSVLRGDISVKSGAVLRLNGARVEGCIRLEEGARVEGAGNVFTSSSPFGVGGSVHVSEALSGLTDSRYEAGAVYLSLGEGYLLSGNVSLPAPEPPFLGYRMGNYFSSGATITFAEGADVYLISSYNWAHIEGSFVFEGQSTLYLLDESGLADEDGMIWLRPSYNTENGMLIDLGNATVHGTPYVMQGVDFRANGATFCAQRALVLPVEHWNGGTAPACLAQLQNCTFAEGAYVAWNIYGLGGTTLSWNEATMQQLLSPAGCSRAELALVELQSGDHLILPANTQWKNRPVLVREGAVLECGKGCRLADGIREVEDDGDVEYNPAVVVANGGTLVADNLTIDGTLVLAPGAKVTGSLHFAKGSRIRLIDWSGSTQQLLDSVLADATWTADAPPLIEIEYTYLGEGYDIESMEMISGDTTLADLGSRFGGYVVGEDGGYYASDWSLTVSRGVDIAVEDWLDCTGATFEGDNVVSLAAGYDGYVYMSGSSSEQKQIVAHGTRFEIPVMGVDADTLSGDNITFAAQIPFGIRLGDYGYSPSDPWDGTAAALQAAIDKALQNVAGYTIAAKNPILGLSVGGLAADLLLSPETMAGMLPAGFAGLHFEDLYIEDGRTVRVARGATLDCGNVSVSDGGTLIIEAGAALIDSLEPIEHEPDIGVMDGGTLSMTGVDFAGAYIYVADGAATISDCWGKGSLRLSPYDNAQSVVRVTGCDLSEMDIKLYSNMGDGSAVYDFSGNYWGTSDVEKIKAMISGYTDNASSVIIGEVLDSSPFGPDTTPPEISLLAPQTAKKGEGQTEVTLAWSASADAVRYELRVDGKLAYSGAETTHTLTLKDGSHSYSVKAWDEAGNAATAQGDAFTLDATAPALTLNSPRMEKPGNGSTRVTLSWSANEAATYELRVNGELQAISGNSHTLELADGSYSYSVSATDARGNSVTQEGRFTCDASAPALTMDSPVITSARKGKTKLTFNWSGEDGSTYTLMLNGKKVYSGTKTSYSATLADGTHRYTLVAKDATGNDATLTGSVVTDATAPVITLKNPAFEKAGEGRVQVTLNWWTNEAATCTVQVDKMAVYTVEGNSFTLPAAIADGKHSYVITATDALGNSSTKKGSFSYDATAPKLTLSTPKLKKAGEGRVAVTLKWKGESKATYCVCVDGKPAYTYEGTGSSCTFTLPDGAHSYTVTATDKAGNSITREGSFSYDATAPELSLLAPALTKAGAGKLFATLNWAGTGADTYILKVDGKKKYEGSATSFSLDLKDGKHSYSVTAQDAAGNKVTQEGTFTYDATAPKLKLKKPVLSKAGQGAINALFRWTTEKDAVCRLIVDGEERYSGKGSSCQLRLEGDKHSYFVEVVDAAGNITRSEEAGISLDTTDPAIVLTAPVGMVSGSAVKTTLSWLGEAGVSYTVKVDHKKVASGKKLTCSVNLTPGEHDFTITAKDAAGNTSTLSTTLTVSVPGGKPQMELPSAERRLSWQAEDTEGIADTVGWGNSSDTYRFTLAQAETLTLRLGGLEAPASLLLLKDYGLGVVEQQARYEVSGGNGLDRELALSAGTYCLQLKGYDASLAQYNTGYTLDLELGRGEERRQAVLASLS